MVLYQYPTMSISIASKKRRISHDWQELEQSRAEVAQLRAQAATGTSALPDPGQAR